MIFNPIDAVAAYRKTSALPQEGGAGAAGVSSPEQSFGSVLQDVIGDTVGQIKTAETTSQLGVAGKAGPVEIATAVASAETTLQMVVVLRDKMIAAYQEVSRMSI